MEGPPSSAGSCAAMGPVLPGSSMALRSAAAAHLAGARTLAAFRRHGRCGGWPPRRTRVVGLPPGPVGIVVHGAAVDERGVAVGGAVGRVRGAARAGPLALAGARGAAVAARRVGLARGLRHLGVGLAVRAPRGGRAAAAGCPGVGAAVAPRGRGAVGVGPAGRAAGARLLPVRRPRVGRGPGSASARRRPCAGRGDRAIGRRSPRRVAPVVLGGRAVATPRRRSGGAAVRTTGPPAPRATVGGRAEPSPPRQARLGPPFAGAAEPSPAPHAAGPPLAGAAEPSPRTQAVGARAFAGAAEPSPAPHAPGPPLAGASRTVALRPTQPGHRSQAPPNRRPDPTRPGHRSRRRRTVAGAPRGRAAVRGAVRVVAGASRCRGWEHRSARRRRAPTAGAGGPFGGAGLPLAPAVGSADPHVDPVPLTAGNDPLCGAWPTAGNDRWSARRAEHRPRERPAGRRRCGADRRERPAVRHRGDGPPAVAGWPPTAGNAPLPVPALRRRPGCAVAGRRVPAAPAGGAVRADDGVATAGGARPRARVLGGAPARPATGCRAVTVRGEQLRDGALTGVIGLRAHRVHRAPDDVKRPSPAAPRAPSGRCGPSHRTSRPRARSRSRPFPRGERTPPPDHRPGHGVELSTCPQGCPQACPGRRSALTTSRIVVTSSAARAGARRPAVIDVAPAGAGALAARPHHAERGVPPWPRPTSPPRPARSSARAPPAAPGARARSPPSSTGTAPTRSTSRCPSWSSSASCASRAATPSSRSTSRAARSWR